MNLMWNLHHTINTHKITHETDSTRTLSTTFENLQLAHTKQPGHFSITHNHLAAVADFFPRPVAFGCFGARVRAAVTFCFFWAVAGRAREAAAFFGAAAFFAFFWAGGAVPTVPFPALARFFAWALARRIAVSRRKSALFFELSTRGRRPASSRA